MTGFVVDTSVAVKWVVYDPLSNKASYLLRGKVPILAPDLIYADIANILWTIVKRGDLTGDDLLEALELLDAAPIVITRPTKRLIKAAARLANELNFSVYDCIYLTLAIQEKLILITADQAFYEATRNHPYLSKRVSMLDELSESDLSFGVNSRNTSMDADESDQLLLSMEKTRGAE